MLGLVISTRERVFGLDFLRVLAILCVVHGHGKTFLYGTRMEWLADLPLPHGVDLFFVLSGFLIGLSVMKMLDRGDLFPNTWSFYSKTALRILPNYYALLVVNLLLVTTGVVNGDLSAKPLYRFATLTQNIVTPFYDFYWESWSVPIQWWFYITFPLLAYALKRFAGRYAIPAAVMLVVAASTIFRMSLLPDINDEFYYDIAVRKTLASRWDSIYVGVLAAWVCREFPVFWRRSRWWMFGLAMLLYVIVEIVDGAKYGFYSVVIMPILVPLVVGMALPVLDSWRSAKGWCGNAITAVSILSYSMFMVNLIMAEIIACQLTSFADAHGCLAYLLFWAMVLTGTAALYYAVERPAMLIRQKVMAKN